MYDGGTTMKIEAYVIVLRERLIANDLEMMISDARPGAIVRHVTAMDPIEGEVPDGARLTMVFTADRPAVFMSSSLAARLSRDKGHVVFMGYDKADLQATLPPGNWSSLAYPFALADVMAVLTTTS